MEPGSEQKIDRKKVVVVVFGFLGGCCCCCCFFVMKPPTSKKQKLITRKINENIGNRQGCSSFLTSKS